jgi:aerobic-type carbon monoxide dehydrogenase small subunit (CoxS/CutS family)
MDSPITFTVNGGPRTVSTDPNRPLLEVLREECHLHGVRFGCGEGECGACGVLVDGKRIFSCQTVMSEVAGKSITTIEGLSDGEKLHPVQQAFLEEGAYQCGYCVSGMIIAAVSLLNEKPKPTEAEITDGMNGNLCRCCGYAKIVKAVRRAAGLAQVASGGKL